MSRELKIQKSPFLRREILLRAISNFINRALAKNKNYLFLFLFLALASDIVSKLTIEQQLCVFNRTYLTYSLLLSYHTVVSIAIFTYELHNPLTKTDNDSNVSTEYLQSKGRKNRQFKREANTKQPKTSLSLS